VINILTGAGWRDIGEGPPRPPPCFLGKKEEMTEGRKAGRACKAKPGLLPAPRPLPLSSRPGGAMRD